MASSATFRVINPEAPRECVDSDVRDVAELIAIRARDNAPVETGRLAASYRVRHGEAVACYLVYTEVPYAVFVEYGTRFMPAQAPLGRAATGWKLG